MDKRRKVKILSFVMGVILLLSHELGLQDSALAALFSAVLIYFGLYWILEFNVIGLRLIFVFVLPILFDFMFVQQALSLESTFGISLKGGLFVIVALVFGILNYALILTANILNVASVKKIPLLQVAQTSAYFFTVFLYFLILSFVRSMGHSVFFDLVLVLIFSFLLLYQLLWFIIENRRTLFFLTLVVSVALSFVYLTLSFVPISFILLNVSMAGALYILAGMAMHSEKKSLNNVIMLEYIITSLMLIVIILLSADWGSFGNLFS